MVEIAYIQPDETVRVNTKSNTIVVVNTTSDVVNIADANNNLLTQVAGGEAYTLPIDSGEYFLYNPNSVAVPVVLARFFVY